MKKALLLSVLAALSAASVISAQDVVYQKCDVIDSRGKQTKADLRFSDEKKEMIVAVADRSIAEIPYASIDKVSYEYSKHHRVTTGALVMVASLGAGAVVMLTKAKNHWLYVDYREGSDAKSLTLRMDKKEYKDILDTAAQVTGKPVDMLNGTGKSKKHKKSKHEK